jgi:hypothetical protein
MAERSQTLPADFELSPAVGIRTGNHGIGSHPVIGFGKPLFGRK